MKLINLHEKDFLSMNEAERIRFLEKYRNRRKFQLMTATAKYKLKKNKKTKKGKVKKLKVDPQLLQQLKLAGLV